MTRPESTKRHSGEDEAQEAPSPQAGALHKWMMTACLVLMGGAVLLVMWLGPPVGAGIWLLLLPMGLCLGMHLFMHRHGQHRDE